MPATVSRLPRRAISRRAVIVGVRAIFNPNHDVAKHVVEAELVRRKTINRRRECIPVAARAEGRHGIFQNETLVSIAAKYRKSVAQVILRWHVQRHIIVIPKSVKKARMIENLSVFDFALSDEDMSAIRALDTKTSAFFDHRDPEWEERLSTRRLNI